MTAPSSGQTGHAGPARERVVMITSSYPRFPGDTVGTFLEPIAHGVAARGHDVHVVLPAHPLLQRSATEGRVHFHPFKYAPVPSLNVFGYAGSLKADVSLRFAAVAAAPLALAAAWRTARRVAHDVQATVIHAHWVIPCGAVGAAVGGDLPLVISLHGSDVFVAERHRVVGRVARAAFRRAGWVTACSDDLRLRAVALGADPARSNTVPYGVDAERFKPDAAVRAKRRTLAGLGAEQCVVFTAGRLVRKKGFEYLIDALPTLVERVPNVTLVLGGDGDLDKELRARAAARGISDRVVFTGVLNQAEVAEWLAAADVAVVPSVKDDSGNVDGLPNVVMEALASGTPLVATDAGGIGSVARDDENALIVGQRDPAGLARAIGNLLADTERRRRIGDAARRLVLARHSWARVAEAFEQAYVVASAGRRGGPACPSSDEHAMV